MDLGPISLAKILLPKTPLLFKTAVLNTLCLSPNASKQDLRTEVTVSLIRELIKIPSAIGKTQKGSMRDPGIKGKMWISKVTLPKAEDSEGVTPREALDIAIKELGEGSETYTLPETLAVEAEWTGYRSGVDGSARRPDLSEVEHYERLMSEVKSDVTVLYFHGGAYIVMDPASHRIPTSQLAKLTSGRCLSVRYRLAPQNPFPAAILDGLIAYLSLLSPPPNSLHSPVQASNIVFAGDSAGGNLALCLSLLILTLRRKGITSLRFHGHDVPLPLPAGLALNSPWCDISRSMPSCHSNASYDYITPPADFGFAKDAPADDVWPVKPPRIDMYVNASALIHPLVSPLAAPPELWKGAPPVYMCVGSEGLEDECAVLARRLSEADVPVRFDGYEGMPHCFGMIFPSHPLGRECMNCWAGFMRDVVDGRVGRQSEGQVKSVGKATWAKAFKADPVQRWEVPIEKLKMGELEDEVVQALLKEKREKYLEREGRMVREWREGEMEGEKAKKEKQNSEVEGLNGQSKPRL